MDLTGKIVESTRVLNDLGSIRFDAIVWPIPFCILDVDVIFAPLSDVA